MPEMPIPQEYNRYIKGEEGSQPDLDDKESIFEVLDDITGSADEGVEELPDGSAVIRFGDLKGPDENPDFYENLADSGTVDEHDLDNIAIKFLDLIEKDKQAREDRDKQYEDGLRRTGLGHDAPGGAQFMGASKVVHPVMAEACVDFAARAIKELFPADGPVRSKIMGEVTKEKQERADRKRDFMNWQLTEQIEEYRDEEEQMLTQLPLGGSQYLKMWYDESKKRPCCEFVPIDNVYLPFAAGNFYTAGRVTEVQDITQEEYDLRVKTGLYADVDVYKVSMEPDESKSQKANDKIEGRSQSADNVDGIRRVFHIFTWLELEDDKLTKGDRAPYILMVDEQSRSTVGLYRNWEDGDDTFTKLDWLIEFKFIPWRGAYAIGLPHLIGGLSAALTGALRALLDSAHINTAPTMLKLKGAKISGQSTVIEPTQVSEIEGAPGVDDIRKIAMPVPFNPPSPVLFELLGWLTAAAKGVVTTSEEKIADVTSNAPVGTTQALIEQGAAVFSSIHSRLHDSQRRVFKVLTRLNRWYLDEQRKSEVVADLVITQDDFKYNSDVIPVSDPHIFAESQRYAQIQTLSQRAQANPDLYNRLEVEKRILKQIKLPDINAVLPDPHEVEDMNPALENVAMTLGKPVGAFPAQDHLAHMLCHLQYDKDPIFGSNPIVAPVFKPAVLEHLKQHLTLWYLNTTQQYAMQALDKKGHQFDIYKIQPHIVDAQKMIASVLGHVHMDSQQMLGEVGQSIQQISQAVQQLNEAQHQQQIDPSIQAQVAATQQSTQMMVQQKAQEAQQRAQIEGQKIQADMQKAQLTNQTAQQEIAAKTEAEQAKLQMSFVENTQNNLIKKEIEFADMDLTSRKIEAEMARTIQEAQDNYQNKEN
jgi:hypothetical protein